MDRSSQYSDPNPFGSPPSMSVDYQEASSLSDGSTSRTTAHSDEEVFLLATSCPKKRAGRRIFQETRHPVYRGVRRRNGDKWVCEVREPNKKSRIWLGTYPTPEMAARAHDVAALALRGKSACLNFADSAWRLPLPVSKDAMDIRRAASEAADLFRPQDQSAGHEATTQHVIAAEDPSEACSEEYYKTVQKSNSLFYMDEDATFDMPGLLVDMAGGLLLSPPNYARDGSDWELNEGNTDWALWNHM